MSETGNTGPEAAKEPRPVEKGQNGLTSEDRRRIASVDSVLRDALDLKTWWDGADARWRAGEERKAYRESFDLIATHNRPDKSIGFFDETEVGDRKMAVMGNVQEQFYDRPKSSTTAVDMRKQMQEFVLRYFMRISDYSEPIAFPEYKGEPVPTLLRPFSFCPSDEVENQGFGYELAYYKKPGESAGKFGDENKYAIIDLREIGTTYEWIVVKVAIYDFKFEIAPFGTSAPFATVPMGEASYLVISEEFVRNEEKPGGDLIGSYGYGYGFLPSLEESVVAYGPGEFEAAFQIIHFNVKNTGEVMSRMAFVSNRPKKVVDLSLDPVHWGLRAAELMSFGMASAVAAPFRALWREVPQLPGVDLAQLYITGANALSLGLAEKQLCVSKKQLEKIFLVKHFIQHYKVIAGSLVTWRMIPDWADPGALPDWVRSGVSA